MNQQGFGTRTHSLIPLQMNLAIYTDTFSNLNFGQRNPGQENAARDNAWEVFFPKVPNNPFGNAEKFEVDLKAISNLLPNLSFSNNISPASFSPLSSFHPIKFPHISPYQFINLDLINHLHSMDSHLLLHHPSPPSTYQRISRPSYESSVGHYHQRPDPPHCVAACQSFRY